MRNSIQWRESKYVFHNGKLTPSGDTAELAVTSRHIAYLLASHYQPALRLHASGHLLDLGCGKVPFHAAYRDSIESSTCVDWPQTLHRNPHIDVYCDLTRPLPFMDASFDTVLSSDVIEHLPDPVLAFREMGRVLRPGGKLVLNTPFFYMLHEMPHDYYRHTRFSLERLARLANMEVVTLTEIGGLHDVFCDLVSKVLGRIPGIGAALAGLVQGITTRLSSCGPWRRLTAATAARFPLGYFLIARKAEDPCLLTPDPAIPDGAAHA